MAERPILFQGAMVRAILAGTKTQTRRTIKLKTGDTFDEHALAGAIQERRPVFDKVANAVIGTRAALVRCPYGQPGDRLWVRESHWYFKDQPDPVTGYFPPKPTAEDVEYRADGEKPGRIWRPSIHMPRWACRIELEVTEVRVQRLWDISEVDAQAEGWDGTVLGYAKLWESINGAGSWDANPYVWAVSFRKITP